MSTVDIYVSQPRDARQNPARAQKYIVAIAGVLIVLLVLAANMYGAGWRVPALACVGVALGFVLFAATFGFAGSFRAVLQRGDAAGFRAQAIALALCTIVFFPLLAVGDVSGTPLSGFGAPIGISFIIGGVLFGIGMQLGGGCASGTLFALGGGNVRLVFTLLFFVVGSALGAAHVGFWRTLPALDTGTTQDWVGWQAALALHLAIFALVIWRVKPAPPLAVNAEPASWFARPWPLVAGAVALAALNVMTLVLAGRPWGETAGFTLWGSKLALLASIDVTHWSYWRGDTAPLFASVFSDVTSVMDLGIILGATLAGQFERPVCFAVGTRLRAVGRCCHWRRADGVRCPPFGRLQHRRVFLSAGIRQSVWMGMGRCCLWRQRDRSRAAPRLQTGMITQPLPPSGRHDERQKSRSSQPAPRHIRA